ncbi:MAG: DUF481 domain-containing protein [Verrucomicrobiales bacterium]|jgi:putative salt-induced outer membrane protein YdiY|nr:DUF481 domain-containing protein [Verrucomicrobiales bacterium]
MKRLACILLILGAPLVRAQDADVEIVRLRAELEAARRENADLVAELAALKDAPKPATVAAADSAVSAKLKSPWQLEVSAGGNYATGNINAYRGNAGFQAVRETDGDQLVFKLAGEYGKTDGNLDAERLFTEVNYRHNIADHFYWFVNGSFLHDGASGLDFRDTTSPGLGYYFVKNSAVTLLVEGGPAYVWERQEGNANTSSVRGRLAQEFDWQFTDSAKLFERFAFLDNLQNTGDWVGLLEGGIETAVTKTITLRLSARYQYENTPADHRQKADFSAIGALVYKFGKGAK